MKKGKVIFMVELPADKTGSSHQIRDKILFINDIGECYLPFFITLEEVKNHLVQQNGCFAERNLVVLAALTQSLILSSLTSLMKSLDPLRWWFTAEKGISEYKSTSEYWEEYDIDCT